MTTNLGKYNVLKPNKKVIFIILKKVLHTNINGENDEHYDKKQYQMGWEDRLGVT